MHKRRIFWIMLAIVGMLPTLAHADFVFVGRQDASGQGFGNVLNVLTLQTTQTGNEAGSVSWNGTSTVVDGTTTNGCPAGYICNGPDTGADNNVGKTSSPTIADVGWTAANQMGLSLNINQTGVNQDIVVENGATLNIYSATGTLLHAFPIIGHTFTTIEQGTGTGFFVWELNAAEQAFVTANPTLLTGTNHIGISNALLDNTANDGAETFGVVKVTPIPEPGFYGVLALGLSTMCFFVRRRRKA